jgi:hypothetical protein
LLRKPEVKSYIEAEANGDTDPGIADRTERLRFLTAIMRGRDPYGGDGDDFVEVRRFFQPKDRLRAAELLCRVAGDFRDTQVQETNNNTQINVLLSPEDREEARRRVSGRRDVQATTIDAGSPEE